MGELRREGPWALRSLGYSFSVADRATPLLMWTQAVHGEALALLRLGEDLLRERCASTPLQRKRHTETCWHIDASERCLLQVGPPIIDLLVCDARNHGRGHVVVESICGLLFAASLTALAVRRGVNVFACYASGGNEIVRPRFAVSGWIAAAPGKSVPRFLAGALSQDLTDGEPWWSAMGFPRIDKGVLADMGVVRSSQHGLLTLRAFPARQPQAQLGEGNPLPAWKQPMPEVDWPQHVARAEREGMLVEQADLDTLYALEALTWAPTSERSRRQAAF